MKSEIEVAQSCLTRSDPMDCSLPGSSIHGISRQEYWSGLPLPSPGLSAYTELNHVDLNGWLLGGWTGVDGAERAGLGAFCMPGSL